MMLDVVLVEQGNGRGKSIQKDSSSVLKTTDLVGCIAVLIVGKKNCHMIHSDTNSSLGKGHTSLISGIQSLALNQTEHYEIGLIGGTSPQSLKIKYNEVKKALPNSSLIMTHLDADAAYLDNQGHMAHTKRALETQLDLSSDNDEHLELIEDNPDNRDDYSIRP